LSEQYKPTDELKSPNLTPEIGNLTPEGRDPTPEGGNPMPEMEKEPSTEIRVSVCKVGTG
jgi:hypothetical protein